MLGLQRVFQSTYAVVGNLGADQCVELWSSHISLFSAVNPLHILGVKEESTFFADAGNMPDPPITNISTYCQMLPLGILLVSS